MAVPTLIGDLIEVQIFTQFSVQTAVNRLHYRVSGQSGPVSDVDIMEAFTTALPPLWLPLVSAAATYQGLGVQLQRGNVLYQAIFSAVNAGVGTYWPLMLPQQVTGLVTTLTGLGGRQGRGRMYLPFPGTNGVFPPNAVPPERLPTVNAFCTKFLTPVTVLVGGNTSTLTPILVHRRNKAGVVLSPTDITGFRASDRWATQRRRGQYGKPNFPPVFPAP